MRGAENVKADKEKNQRKVIELTGFGSTSLVLFHLPHRRKIDFTLSTAERLLRLRRCLLVLRQIVDDVLKTQQVNELTVAGIRDEVHLWRRWLGWRNLQQSFFELLAQGELGCRLLLSLRLVVFDARRLIHRAVLADGDRRRWCDGHGVVQVNRRLLQNRKRLANIFGKISIDLRSSTSDS